MAAVQDFYFSSRYADRRGQPGVCDFTFGNPQEFPLPGLVQALHRQADLQSESWYAYKTNEADACAFLAVNLSPGLGLPIAPVYTAITPWACGALALTFRALPTPGNELLFPPPGSF